MRLLPLKMEVQQAASEAATKMEGPGSEATTKRMKKPPPATTKMKEPVSKAATTKGPSRVITVDTKKREQGLRVAEWNCQNRGKLKAQKNEPKPSQYYGTGAVMAVGALSILSYYVYQSKKKDATLSH